MAYKIIVRKRFTNKVVRLLSYLETEWNKEVAKDFLGKLDKRIQRLSLQPYIGVQLSNHKDTRSVLVTKHNRLYYRIGDETIEIINLYDTRINPRKNPYKRK